MSNMDATPAPGERAGINPWHSHHLDLLAEHGGCLDCTHKALCLPADLQGESLRTFDEAVWRPPYPIRSGHVLVREGDTVRSLYYLRVGLLKSVIVDADGNEQVAGLRFPGTIIGLAESDYRRWSRTFVALDDTWVCRIPLQAINEDLHPQLIRLMQQRLRREREYRHLRALRSGPRKLIAFLLELSGNTAGQGLPADTFRIPLSYRELASYLNMSQSAVAGGLKQLQDLGLVDKRGKIIHIRDRDAFKLVEKENRSLIAAASARFGK